MAELDRLDRVQQRRESPVKVAKIDLEALATLDLREVPSTRMRIKGSANWVKDSARAKFGGTEYLLVREPENEFDTSAVAVYGKGRKVGYLSSVKAAGLAPILDPLGFDAFIVGGVSVFENSIRLWVDVPVLAELRRFLKPKLRRGFGVVRCAPGRRAVFWARKCSQEIRRVICWHLRTWTVTLVHGRTR